MDEELEQMKLMVELDTIQLGSIGCYHFKLSDTAVAMSSFSVNVQGGPRVRRRENNETIVILTS